MGMRQARGPHSGFELVNVDRRHQENPESFFVYPLEARERVHEGLLVKLIFELPKGESGDLPEGFHNADCGDCGHKVEKGDRASGERMWVEVTERKDHDGRILFRGVLKNEPFVLEGRLEYGQTIEFGPEHILDMAEKEEHGL